MKKKKEKIKEIIASTIEHTNLDPRAKRKDIRKLCAEATKYGFHAVCVLPYYVKFAKKCLQNKNIKIVAVVGYPLGANKTETKVCETKKAIEDGADEIDMVMNIAAFKNKEYETVKKDISSVVACKKPVKVIIETDFLDKKEKIKACKIVEEAGASFVKTSTRKILKGATVQDIKIMRKIVKIGIKASGGIDSAKKAIAMLKAGANRIGTSHSIKIIAELK